MAQKKMVYKKRVLWITTGVVLALLFLVALIYNAAALGTKNRRIRKLEQEIADFDHRIENNYDELEYRKTPEYIEKFARDHLDMVKPGDSAYLGK